MILTNLKLRGAIGIYKGLGLEEIEIDFTIFQPGLIALTGKNGAGKTTVMEMLHPHRTMVSRDGAIESHFFLKDSHKILDFIQNGKHYRSLLQIDAMTQSSKAYLQIVEGDQVTSLNDGLKKTYDEELEKILGSQDLFFNSVFSGQKSKGIAELKAGERRKLFYELLNLLRYEAYCEATKAKLKKEELKLSEIEGQITFINEDKKDLKAYEDLKLSAIKSRDEAINNISGIKANIVDAETHIKKMEAEIIKLQEKAKSNLVLEEKVKKLEEEREQYIESYNTDHSSAIFNVEDTESNISETQKLLASKVEIETSIKRKNVLESEINELKLEQNNLNSEQSVLNNQRSDKLERSNIVNDELFKLDKIRDADETKRFNLAEKIDGIRDDADLINEVPCGDITPLESDVDFSSCRLLVNAYEAKDKLPALEKELEELQKSVDKQTADLKAKHDLYIENLNKINKTFESETEKLNKKTQKITSKLIPLQQELEELGGTDWSAKQKDLYEAETNMKVFNERLEGYKSVLKTLEENHDKKIKKIDNDIENLENEIDPDIETNIAGWDEDINVFQANLKSYNEEKEQAETEVESFKDTIVVISNDISEILGKETKLAELEVKRKAIQKEIQDWTFLVKAFDKTGIPVLKLENSGVEISAITNELLALFENKFRIVFETTAWTKDKKKLKETFDINIVEEDGITEIGNKSGGQQVWLETAIQSAISLVVRQQGLNIQTSFLDEKDGALDLENAHSYIEMIRKAHDMSGVNNTFIITHRPELLNFIPQQVKLADGRLTILN